MTQALTLDPQLLETLQAICGSENVEVAAEKVAKLSKDFYWYSPILKEQLDDKVAACAAVPQSIEELKSCVAACFKYKAPITIRGGGTGNYGQCIPLYGGVIIDLTRFDKILSIEDGVLRSEPGARLHKIEIESRAKGFELRCLPSTWVKSTIGGFLAGGSGGIGSIKWGGIKSGDNVKSVTLLTVESEPRLIKFEGLESHKALHTYGTNGILVEIEMRLAPKLDYMQLIVCHQDWNTLFDWANDAARISEFDYRLVSGFQDPIPSYFKPLRKYFEEGDSAAFFLVAKEQVEKLKQLATAGGMRIAYEQPLSDPPKPPYITDYTWNHTTLWAMKEDPTITYLQAGFPGDYRDKMGKLLAKFPGEVFIHLEWTYFNSEPGQHQHLSHSPDAVTVGGIPLVKFKSKERLQEILDYCAEVGIGIANPHTYFVEEGSNHPDIGEKLALKDEVDPLGILNPGKLKTYANNPFAEVETV